MTPARNRIPRLAVAAFAILAGATHAGETGFIAKPVTLTDLATWLGRVADLSTEGAHS
jgi:hypothetical protein